MSISESIKAHREARGMTQQQLAERLYITRQAVSRWETGETTPGIDMTKLIAATLDVPIAELLDMPPEGTFCRSSAECISRTTKTVRKPQTGHPRRTGASGAWKTESS